MQSKQITAGEEPPDKTTSIRVCVCFVVVVQTTSAAVISARPDRTHTHSQTGPPIPGQMAAERESFLWSSRERGGRERKQMSGGGGGREGAVCAPGSRQFVNEREPWTPPSVTARHQTLQPTKHNADQHSAIYCCYPIP